MPAWTSKTTAEYHILSASILKNRKIKKLIFFFAFCPCWNDQFCENEPGVFTKLFCYHICLKCSSVHLVCVHLYSESNFGGWYGISSGVVYRAMVFDNRILRKSQKKQNCDWSMVKIGIIPLISEIATPPPLPRWNITLSSWKQDSVPFYVE